MDIAADAAEILPQRASTLRPWHCPLSEVSIDDSMNDLVLTNRSRAGRMLALSAVIFVFTSARSPAGDNINSICKANSKTEMHQEDRTPTIPLDRDLAFCQTCPHE